MILRVFLHPLWNMLIELLSSTHTHHVEQYMQNFRIPLHKPSFLFLSTYLWSNAWNCEGEVRVYCNTKYWSSIKMRISNASSPLQIAFELALFVFLRKPSFMANLFSIFSTGFQKISELFLIKYQVVLKGSFYSEQSVVRKVSNLIRCFWINAPEKLHANHNGDFFKFKTDLLKL